MANLAKPKDLKFLRNQAEQESLLQPYAARLEMIRDRIKSECPDAVAWAVAFGRFLKLLDHSDRVSRTPRDGLEILTVTTLESIYDAHVLLAEKVFGPTLLEFGKLPEIYIWTIDEFDSAVRSEHQLWRRVSRDGVSIYGSRDAIYNYSDSNVPRDRRTTPAGS